MATTLPFWCANDPKDFSLWDAHEDTLRRLFLTEGKSLGEVKTAMEERGFPQTSVKIYEVVLRKHFKFQKNLEAGQWLLVGQELDKWKSQGLECVVFLSGIAQDRRLVDRRIRRERAKATRGKLKHGKSQKFPDAVTILPKVDRTLEVAGPTPRNTADHLESLFVLNQDPEPRSTNLSALMSLSDPRLSQHQLSHDAHVVGLQAGFLEHILRNPITKVYETLGRKVPSRELVNFLRDLWENTRLSPSQRAILGEILCGFTSSTRNMTPFRNERLPDPRLFGLNSSFSVLETACTSLCNGDMDGVDRQLLPPMRKWLATVADIGVLQQFFSIPKPAVAAMWNNLIRRFQFDLGVFSILIEVALRVHRGQWIHGEEEHCLGIAILHGDRSTAERLLDPSQASPVTVEQWVRSEIGPNILALPGLPAVFASVPLMVRLFSEAHVPRHILDTHLAALFWQLDSLQAAAVLWLVEEGTKIQPAISDWIPSCARQLAFDWNPAWAPEALSRGDLGEIYRDNPALTPSCRTIFGTFVPFLGLLASARSGPKVLRQFMSSLSTNGPRDMEQILRLALTETTRRHDIEATQLLLETGIFIKMQPFPRHRVKPGFQHLSDPVLRSARRSDMEMLQLLLSHTLFKNYHVSDILQAMSFSFDQSLEPRWLHVIDFLLEKEGSSLKDIWNDVSKSSNWHCQAIVLQYMHRRFSRQRAPYLDPSDLLPAIFPDDTLREAIKHGFGIDAIESLVAAGIPIPSATAGEESTLLIDALLTSSKDQYKIVHFLLRNGADPRKSSPKYTVLEATLWEPPWDEASQWGQAIGNYSVRLDLFKELSQLGAPLKRETTAITPPRHPLLSLLIQNHADISLLQQAVAAGAGINEQGTMHPWTPLNTAICLRQSDTVRWLLEQGADVNACPRKDIFKPVKFCHRYTALEYAILEGDTDIIILLLSFGAIINNPYERSWSIGKYWHLNSAVDSASQLGRLDIFKLLVESGGQSAYPGVSGLDGAFWEADRTGRIGILMFLEQYTGSSAESVIESVNERIESGEPGWVVKSKEGQIELVR